VFVLKQLFIDLYLGAKTRLMQLINHENNGLAVVAPAMLIFAFCVVCVSSCLSTSFAFGPESHAQQLVPQRASLHL
jgi:hypothetical protein